MATIPLAPDYGWRRPSSGVPKQGEQVVVDSVESDRHGYVGVLANDQPGWRTVGFRVDCEVTQLYRAQVRKLRSTDEVRVVNLRG